MKKRLTLMFSGIPEALAEGAMIFPVYAFTAIFSQRFGEVPYVMPFVLWYALHRAGTFFVNCFGTVRNPCKVCACELLCACLGGLLLLLWPGRLWCGFFAAVLMGLGTSCYSAMFRTAIDEMQDQGAVDLKGSLYVGYAVFLLAILMIPYLGINDAKVMAWFLSLMVFGSTLFVLSLWKRDPHTAAPPFGRNDLPKENLPYGLSVLVLTFFVRLLRQTASEGAMALLPIAFVLLLFWGNKYKREPYRAHSMRTLWYGAVNNFLDVFPLFAYTSSGNAKALGLVYLMVGVGSTIAAPASAVARKVVPPDAYEPCCIILAILSSFLMPVPGLYLLGTVLTSLFVTMGEPRPSSSTCGMTVLRRRSEGL